MKYYFWINTKAYDSELQTNKLAHQMQSLTP
jgi:hypothetical protein